MCFPKPPKPPKTTDAGADPALTRERQQAEFDNAALKADNKQRRMEDSLAALSGRIGRKSLFTGGQGGAGFPNRRSLFSGQPITPPSPGGTGVPGPTPPSSSGGGVARPPLRPTRRAISLIGGKRSGTTPDLAT
jgi:hypothetical protein